MVSNSINIYFHYLRIRKASSSGSVQMSTVCKFKKVTENGINQMIIYTIPAVNNEPEQMSSRCYSLKATWYKAFFAVTASCKHAS